MRDVTYDEDRHRARTGNAPQVMASLRNLAIAILRLSGTTNIAQELRHHARQPERPLAAIVNLKLLTRKLAAALSGGVTHFIDLRPSTAYSRLFERAYRTAASRISSAFSLLPSRR